MYKYGVLSGPYFPVFGLNTGKYGPEEIPYFDTFHVVHTTYRSLGEDNMNLIDLRTMLLRVLSFMGFLRVSDF